MAKWTEICEFMGEYARKDNEKTYQKSIKDFVLKNGLGWKSSQIEEQKSMQFGSTERLIPDLIISTDGCTNFVVDVKKADHVRTQRNVDQLVSYMKQLETLCRERIGSVL